VSGQFRRSVLSHLLLVLSVLSDACLHQQVLAQAAGDARMFW